MTNASFYQVFRSTGRGVRCGLSAFCLLANVVARESVVIAASGDTPSGVVGTFFEIDSSYLTNSGEVFFKGTLRENGQFKNSGLFKGNGDRNEVLALILSGDPAPNGNGSVFSVADSGYRANASGQVVALLSLMGTQAGNRDNAGLYLAGAPDRQLTPVARKGEMIPDGTGGTLTRTPVGFSLNDAGQIAFSSRVANSNGGFSGDAVYLWDEGVETELFRSGRRTPADDGRFLLLGQATIPRLNQAGQVVLNAAISPDDPSGSRAGIFVVNGASTTTVAREDQPVPDGNGILNGLFLTTPAIGNGGHVAFWSQLRNTTGGASDGAAIFRSEGSGLIEIARRNDPVPDGNGRYLNLFILVDVNRVGEVVFHSSISGASQGSDEGIFVGNGTSHRTIARVGDPSPNGGTLGDITEESVRLNDLGQVVFAAELKFSDPTAPVGSLGLFLHDPSLGLLEVAREQEILPNLGTIARLMPDLRELDNDPVRGSLNAQGQVAYRAFIDGETAVIRWSPPAGAGPVVVPVPEIANSGDEVILRWPETDFNLELESTIDPADGSTWKVRPGIDPVLNGGTFEVALPTDQRQEFFRLRRTN